MSRKKMYQLTERTFLNSDRTKVVPEDSAEAHFLLGPVGHLVDHDMAVALGLKKQEPSENKSQNPVEDKSQKPGEEKEPGKSEVAQEQTNEDKDQEEVREEDTFGMADFSGFEKPAQRTQAHVTLTVLHNAGVEEENIPSMLDADLLAIDGISRTRLDIIRRLYPYPAKEDDDATDDASTDTGTL